ncbi:Uncharacterised protein [Chryseobacterium nakagawai]|uniref:Uncharacterized protein n=1 Tax=Chryseobacterium nakagawai TaxID=1241982 RepID=A0AAD0YR68_CHRNA|nr:hypothetical protein [Chryseobacterium nakagawai]AZA93208.1 hypothetical protein EG343_22670 [Chryseobacterium nakagawai]VEH19862.1 Uncharacterised protein [Chryseobacterium nakagawai]
MKNITIKFLCLFFLFSLLSCNGSPQTQDEERIWLVFQPKVEQNKSVILKLFFRSKPDNGSIKVLSASSNTDTELDDSKIEKEMKSDGKYYFYDIFFEAGALGKSDLPVIEAKINGKTYKSKAATIEVVKKQDVDNNAVRLVLETDKSRYHVNDTIKLSLYEYSKFSQISKFTPADLVKKGAPEALFEVIDTGNVDYEVGIVGFKKYIDANFKVVTYHWNVNDAGKQMATLDGTPYIKNLIFYIKMTAKEKGTFSIPKSRFDYKIYPYEEAFREEMLGPEEVLRTKNRISPQSNALNIIVE